MKIRIRSKKQYHKNRKKEGRKEGSKGRKD